MPKSPDEQYLNPDNKGIQVWNRFSPVGGAIEIDQDEFNAAVEMVKYYKKMSISYDGKIFFTFTEADIGKGLDGYVEMWHRAWMHSVPEEEVIQRFTHDDYWYQNFLEMSVLYARAVAKINPDNHGEITDDTLDKAAEMVATKLILAAEEKSQSTNPVNLRATALFRNFLNQNQSGLSRIQEILNLVKARSFDTSSAQFITGFFGIVRDKIEAKLVERGVQP